MVSLYVPIGGVKVGRAIVTKKARRTATKKPVAKRVDKAKSKARKPSEHIAAQEVAYTLLAAMTGRASPAKAADGDKPVWAYIGSLPEPQRGIAERVDALAAKTLPGLKRSVKWGIAWYGIGDGWCFCCGGFAGHVKLTFGRGTSLKPIPPVWVFLHCVQFFLEDVLKTKTWRELQLGSQNLGWQLKMVFRFWTQ